MEDVKMYISAGKIYNTIIKTKKLKSFCVLGHWSRAYKAAKHSLPTAEMKRLFTDEGQALVKAGRLRDGKQLYVAAQLIDLAVEINCF